jgi:hypothetical protein
MFKETFFTDDYLSAFFTTVNIAYQTIGKKYNTNWLFLPKQKNKYPVTSKGFEGHRASPPKKAIDALPGRIRSQ